MEEQFGPYRLERLIGRGGMGEVFRAFDTTKERVVAVKRLAPHLASDAEFRTRFRRESEVAARLREAHVIPIHDFGEIDGRLYIDMRFVDGLDLDTIMTKEGRLAPERAVRIITQIASALDAAHADGLVHRDVKPSNVLLGDRDFAYLVDFGIATPITGERLTVTGSALGTMSYLAPELFGGHRRDSRIDVYSLTCVLYKVLTGRRPFEADGLNAMMYAHVNVPPPQPSRAAGVAPAFDEVIARGMAKDPDRRYATTGELAEAAHRAATIASLTVEMPHLFRRAPVPAAGPDLGRTVGQRPVAPALRPDPPVASPAPATPTPVPPTPAPAPSRTRRTLLIAAGAVLLVGLTAGGIAVAANGWPAAAPSTTPSTTPSTGQPPVPPTVAAAPVEPERTGTTAYTDPAGRFAFARPTNWLDEPLQADELVSIYNPTPAIVFPSQAWYHADLKVRAGKGPQSLVTRTSEERTRLLGLPGARITLEEHVTLPDATPAFLLGAVHMDSEKQVEVADLVLVAVGDGTWVVAAGTGLSYTWHVEKPALDATLRTFTIGAP
ncbi:serine/threonine-protein kinase [Pseudonocardia sp. TRM90224]|uniref:serine/threonine-protein kinase n=1 Tax=Pseudonocardia sp. TRM90224 TaxID=2812678 RepID=UPI001E461265|nr:serine/threonine-protein kinase [Pseudonocardia sp. TRM90224]